MRNLRTKKDIEGSALLLVLWATGVLLLAITGLITLVGFSLKETVTYQLLDRARELAESGLAFATHPQIKNTDSLLEQNFGNGEGFQVAIESESARIQINQLLKNNNGEGLSNLFVLWGLSLSQAKTVLDCLADWVDKNNFKRLNGAERSDYVKAKYSYTPPNHPFLFVDEMALVLNFDLVSKRKPDWRSYFTLRGNGKMYINEAPGDVIEAFTGATSSNVQTFIRARKSNVQDLLTFKDLTEVANILNLRTETEKKRLEQYFTLNNQILRIKSKGTINTTQKIIEVVYDTKVKPLKYLEWQEK